jgi:hypothetical protein
MGHPAPLHRGESELVIMIAVADRRDAWVGPSSGPETITSEPWLDTACLIESEMALFFECRRECARKTLTLPTLSEKRFFANNHSFRIGPHLRWAHLYRISSHARP